MGISLFFALLPTLTHAASEWRPTRASLFGRALADTGVTQPLLLSLQSVHRSYASDRGTFLQNPGALGSLNEFPKTMPVSSSTQFAGDIFNYSAGIQNPYPTVQALVTAIGERRDQLQTASFEAGFDRVKENVGYSVFTDLRRDVYLSNADVLEINRYMDFGFVLGVGALAFDDPVLGRFDAGTNVRTIVRKGDRLLGSPSDLGLTRDISDGAMAKYAMAFGLDYGFIYTLPTNKTRGWVVQVGWVWRNLGTSQFFLGQSTSVGERFPQFPNNPVIGLGIAAPPLAGGIRQIIRLEASQWLRNRSAADKVAVSYELRFPVLFRIGMGLTASQRFSFGAGLRFSDFEIDLSSFKQSSNSDDFRSATRVTGLEFRYVL